MLKLNVVDKIDYSYYYKLHFFMITFIFTSDT